VVGIEGEAGGWPYQPRGIIQRASYAPVTATLNGIFHHSGRINNFAL
jgi:hypothetical protein